MKVEREYKVVSEIMAILGNANLQDLRFKSVTEMEFGDPLNPGVSRTMKVEFSFTVPNEADPSSTESSETEQEHAQ